MGEWSEDRIAIARGWAALSDILRVDDQHHYLGPFARRTIEDAERGMRRLVFKAEEVEHG